LKETIENPKPFSLLPHRVSIVLLAVVFPLIWVGGLVTTTDAGMAVPDWPNTYNYNMFAYPVRDWFFGPWDLFVEHGHRLLGTLAGILSILLVVVTYWKDPRSWMRWLSWAVLGMVIAQGALGGIRVLLDQRIVAQIHGTVGPGFLALVAAVFVFNSRWWQAANNSTTSAKKYFELLGGAALLAFLLSYCQLGLGAAIRHVSEMASPNFFFWIVTLHILTAVAILVLAFCIFVVSRMRLAAGIGVRWTSFFLSFLVLIQFVLGLSTWVVKFGWPVWFEEFATAAHFTIPEKSFLQVNVVTAHVAVGSLILAASIVLGAKCLRLRSVALHHTLDTEIGDG